MKRREIIAWIIAVLSVAIMISYFAVESKRSAASDKVMEQLKLDKDNLQQQLNASIADADSLRNRISNLNDELNRDITTIAQLEERTKERQPSGYIKPKTNGGKVSDAVVKACNDCMKSTKLPIVVTDDKEYVKVTIADAFHSEDKGGTNIELTDKFKNEVTGKYQEKLDDCNKGWGKSQEDLDKCLHPVSEPEKPISFKSANTVRIAVGLNPNSSLGLNGEYGNDFIRIGALKGLNATAGIHAGAFTDLNGANVQPYGNIGISVKW